MKKIALSILMLLVGSIAFQGFQCASRNMTTAKVAFNNRDYDKSIEYLKMELAANPNNGEAYVYLTEIYMTKQEFVLAAESANKALKSNIDETQKNTMKIRINQIWVEAYNDGVESYSKYLETKQQSHIDKAMAYFDLGISIRPEITDFYNFKGSAYEVIGDTLKAMQQYEIFVEKSMKDITFAKANGLYYDMTRRAVNDKLGKPKNSQVKPSSTRDTSITDHYVINDKDLFLFYDQDKANFMLKGWRFDPPMDRLEVERSQRFNMNTTPIRALAQLHYVRKEFDASLKYIQLFAQIEPTNPEANTSLVALYQELGKTDDALKSVDELTKSDPKNKYAWAQYGDLLQNMSRYQESIDKYEKALEIDPTYEFVLRNIASAYKNLAGDVQRKQQDKIEADSKYKPDYEEYFPHLRKSAEYFSRAMKTPEFANDFQVMGELANIYTVLDQANELKQILNKLEAVESSVPKNKRDQYYLILMKIYGDLKESQKLQEVRAKYDNL